MVQHIGGMEATLDLCSYLTNLWNLMFNFIYQLPLPPGKEILFPYMKSHEPSLIDFVFSHDLRSQFGKILKIYITVTIITCM
jgi:hypothetical protein